MELNLTFLFVAVFALCFLKKLVISTIQYNRTTSENFHSSTMMCEGILPGRFLILRSKNDI